MKIFILYILLIVASSLSGQQEIILSKYRMNQQLFNPAVSGTNGEGEGSITLNYRNQWLGLNGAPKTYMISGESNAFDNKIGIGVNLHREEIGVNSNTGFSGNVNYRIEVEDDAYFVGGLRFGFQNINSDLSEIEYSQSSDPIYDQGNVNFNLISMGFGIYYYTENYYVGLSVPAMATLSSNFNSFAQRHYYAHCGAFFELNEYSDFKLEPTLLIKHEQAAPLQFTLGSKFWFTKDLNLGLFYRTTDAVVISADFILDDLITFGVAYDFTTSELNSEHSGTLELLFSYRFNQTEGMIPMGRR